MEKGFVKKAQCKGSCRAASPSCKASHCPSPPPLLLGFKVFPSRAAETSAKQSHKWSLGCTRRGQQHGEHGNDTGQQCRRGGGVLVPWPFPSNPPYSPKSRLAEQQGKVPVLTLGSPHPKRSFPGGAHSAHGAPQSAPYPGSLSLCPPAWTLASPLMSPTSMSATTGRCRT